MLYAPNQSVHDMLRVSGFLKIVTVASDKDTALAGLAAREGA